jgi:hypothetical protein
LIASLNAQAHTFRWPYLEMAGNKGLGEIAFPLNKLVALPLDYRAPVAAVGAQVSAR